MFLQIVRKLFISAKLDPFQQNCALVVVKISPCLSICDDWKGLKISNYFLHLIVIHPVAESKSFKDNSKRPVTLYHIIRNVPTELLNDFNHNPHF